jgi:MipA family protein
MPMIRYNGESFYVQGVTVGYRFYKASEDEFSVVASPFGQRFLHGDTRDPQLRLLSDRNISVSMGVAWRHTAKWGTLQASAEKVFTDHGGGVFDASYSYPFVEGRLRITPAAGVTYLDSGLNNFYYGISPAEAARSGLPAYHAGGGLSPYLGIFASYQLSDSWLTSAGIHYSFLPGAITNSPMVDTKHTQSYFAGLSYVF